MKAKKEVPKELIDKIMANAKITYTVETVYSCIKKGDTVEIEDNREAIRQRFEQERIAQKGRRPKTL